MKYQKLLYFLQNVGRDPSSLMQEDYLTGLKNRRFLLQFLKKQVDWSALDAHPLSLLIVDIDHFKRINDQYGSSVGDQVLVHLAKILKKVAGKSGLPVLNAGDEFMVLLPDSKKHMALIAAEKLIEQVQENPFFSSDAATEIPVTLSIGVATAPDDAADGKELLSQAKNGLYHAKQAGRNRFIDVGEVSRHALQYLDSASVAGRKFQFVQVNEALKKFKDGISQFVIIDGATGMGKTRFLDVLCRNLEKTPLNVVRVSGVNQESFRPYYLISYIVMALMNQREDRGVSLLESLDEKDRQRLANILPQIGEVDLTGQEIDEKQREAIFRSFSMFFVTLVEDGRLAVLIDDMDYSDPASLHLLRVVMRERSLALFICGTATENATARPKTIPLTLFRSAYSDILGIVDIEMTPLDIGDIEQHVKVVFPEIELPQRFVRELAEVSKGNPLFVEEILRKMINDQKIVRSGHRWKVMQLEKGYFPRSFEEIIRSKIMALDKDSQRFLDCAAAFGETISLSMLTGVSEEKSAMVHDFLNRIIDKGLLRSDFAENDETVRFLSKRIQDVIYDNIRPEQKKSLHAQIGDYQEKLYQHNLLPSAAFLAHHYKRSDNPAKADVYEDYQRKINQKIFNDQEVARYAVDEQSGGGADEIGDVPLSEESLKYIPKLLQSMLVAIRNARLYPPDSKSVVNSFHQLKQLADKLLVDVARVSIIAEKNNILVNGQMIPVGNFQSIAQKIIDFWDRLQIKSLTFVKGIDERELHLVFLNICRLEPKEITPHYWEKFVNAHQLTRIFPRQVRYTQKEAPELQTSQEPGNAEMEALTAYQELDDAGSGDIQRIISALLSAHSKLRLYPAQGPVAKEAAGHVMAVLSAFFEKQPVLNIARIENSLLVNGVKLDVSGFETMAAGFVKFLSDVKLNSVTFLSKVNLADMLAFLSAVADVSEKEVDNAFWQEIAEKKQINGILFDQRTYEISGERPGESDMAPGAVVDAVLMAKEEEVPENRDEKLDIDTFPEQVRDLFLSGDRNGAAAQLHIFCDQYKIMDDTGRNRFLDIFDRMIHPLDWRPGVSYLKFILDQVIPLFDGEKSMDLNCRAGELLFDCGELFLLHGDYSLGTWIFVKLQKFSGTGASLVFQADTAVDRSLDPRLIEVVMDDLKSEDPALQQGAFQLLSSLGTWTVPFLIDTVKRESNMRARRLAVDLIRHKGDAAVEMFKKSLMTESRPEYRARILDVIDSVTIDLMAELRDTLSDTADVVRRAAFRLAERLNTPAVFGLVRELAREADADVAVPAIQLLGKYHPEGTIEMLSGILSQSDDREILVATCRAMGQIADAAFVPALENILMPRRRLIFLKKTDTAVRVAAVYALSRINDIRVVPILRSLADDSDQRVREALKSIQASP